MKLARSLAWMAFGAVLCAPLTGCGSSTSQQAIPTPAITGLFPSNVTAGSQSFTMAISGTNFISDARGVTFAYWNGAARSTSFNASTGQLSVVILASDVVTPGIAQVTVANPTPGGPSITGSTFTIEPVQPGAPVVSAFSPASVNAGASALTLTVNGSSFAEGDVATWNGTQRAATFLTQTQMSFAVTQTDIMNAGLESVSISQPGLIVASPSVNFPVVGASSDTPSISSLTPNAVTHGSGDLQLVVKGSKFAVNAEVEWNGVPVATAFANAGQLIALIPASDLAVTGTENISVMNPTTPATPGGGTSGNSTVTIK